jgi:fumarate reductase subunit D
VRSRSYRRDTLWVAAMVHRVSGVLLAAFLPAHFLALGLTLRGLEALDAFLVFTKHPLIKLSEALLVFLLAVHLLGGLRVLAVEAFTYRQGQSRLAVMALALSGLLGYVFLRIAV